MRDGEEKEAEGVEGEEEVERGQERGGGGGAGAGRRRRWTTKKKRPSRNRKQVHGPYAGSQKGTNGERRVPATWQGQTTSSQDSKNCLLLQ